MKISHHYSHRYVIAIALTEIVQGIVTLITLGLYRPSWVFSVKIHGIDEMLAKVESEDEEAMARETLAEEDTHGYD